MPSPSKAYSLTGLILTQVAVLAVWFSSAAVLTEMGAEAGIATGQLAWLSSATQLGFAAGALVFAALGLADRYDPRTVFALSGLCAAGANLALLWAPIGGEGAVALRALTGAALAGCYPVGMKIAVGWETARRGLLVGTLVGALTLGSALPHLIALLGGLDWRVTIWVTSAVAAGGSLAILTVGLGPWHARAPRLELTAIGLAWTDRRLRYAILGYVGHMWELYALWAWVGVIAAASFAAGGAPPAGLDKLVAFLAIALGAPASVIAGLWADRIGKARVAQGAMLLSALCALAAAVSFGGPVWLMAAVLILWGVFVVPDSAQFSALVADAAPPERVGSLMTLQTALGFLLTAGTVQASPVVAGWIGWPGLMALLAVGPLLGAWAMRTLMRLPGGGAPGPLHSPGPARGGR